MGESKKNEENTPQAGKKPAPVPDPEVPERPRRRTYPAEYKLWVLEEADRLKESGEMGALLRREGLYSSHLTTWRQQREQGALDGLKAKKRGRKAKEINPLAQRLEELERENRKLKGRLKQAETIIDVQKKVSEILGATPGEPPSDEDE